jgi:MFS family permease
MAIFYSATPIGSALGYLVGGAVLHAHGWRAAFFVAGGPGILIALLCLLVVEPVREGPASRRGAGVTGVTGVNALLRSSKELARVPLYAGTVLGYCAYTFALGGFAYWAPVYLHRRYGTAPGRASVVFGLVTVAAGIAGTLGGGWLADRATTARLARSEKGKGGPLGPRETDDATARGNLTIPALGAALGAPLAAVAIVSATASSFFVALFPAEMALFLMSGPINVAILRSSPPALRASAMALSIFAIHALGDLWSPPLIGLVAEYGGKYGPTGGSNSAGMQLALFGCPVVFAIAALVWWKTGRASARLT